MADFLERAVGRGARKWSSSGTCDWSTEDDAVLQLVPGESEYDEDLLAGGGGVSGVAPQDHLALAGDSGEHEPSSFFSGHVSTPRLSDVGSVQLERARFLARAQAAEQRMKAAEEEVAQRILSMRRILELKDPAEQLAEYVALSLEARREADTDIVSELLECATHMSDAQDREVALLGAFFFVCDPPRPKNRGIASLLPIVAAMMEASGGMDHSPF